MKTKEQLLSDIGQIFKFWRLRAKLNKNEMAILFIIVLCAPFVIPFIIGGVLYKLMKLV